MRGLTGVRWQPYRLERINMSLTAIEQQEKYALLGVVMAGRTNNEAKVKELNAEIKEQSAQIKALYAELGISKRHHNKIAEKPKAKAPRKSRAKKAVEIKGNGPVVNATEIPGTEFDLK